MAEPKLNAIGLDKKVWDPFKLVERENKNSFTMNVTRLQRELKEFHDNPLPGIFIAPVEDDITFIHALIIGPNGTPYQGGAFYFVLRCPTEYPMKPPLVKLLTTGGGTMRFNPNFYKNGKVCLSLLGTWEGPAWSPAHTISSVLLSIQSMMNEEPYFNEPGFNRPGDPKLVEGYNKYILHETIRLAMCEMMSDGLDARNMPEDLKREVEVAFIYHFDYFIEACNSNSSLDSKPMYDLFHEKCKCFHFKSLAKRLEEIKKKLFAA